MSFGHVWMLVNLNSIARLYVLAWHIRADRQPPHRDSTVIAINVRGQSLLQGKQILTRHRIYCAVANICGGAASHADQNPIQSLDLVSSTTNGRSGYSQSEGI